MINICLILPTENVKSPQLPSICDLYTLNPLRGGGGKEGGGDGAGGGDEKK